MHFLPVVGHTVLHPSLVEEPPNTSIFPWLRHYLSHVATLLVIALSIVANPSLCHCRVVSQRVSLRCHQATPLLNLS